MKESGEMYLETILLISKRNEYVRSIDIANELNISRASVSRAISILKKNAFITIDEKGWIELTSLGEQKAGGVYERHVIIKDFLHRFLNVGENIAEEDACRIEHILSNETFNQMKRYVEDRKM